MTTVANNIDFSSLQQEKELSATEKKKMSLDETRKSLPVYAFRDAFIEAVREHQVRISGRDETGVTRDSNSTLIVFVLF